MGLADADADRIDEGGIVVTNGPGERGWRKLPYPKFLENTLGSLWCGAVKLWDGKCIFSFRGKVRRLSDGREQDFTAVAAVSEDLTGLLDRVHEADMRFCAVLRVGGGDVVKAFDVVEVLPAHNPDGSFHHVTLRLRERVGGGEDAVCDEYGCAEADFEDCAAGVDADCA